MLSKTAFLNASTASSGDCNLLPRNRDYMGRWSNNSTFSSVKYCLVFWAVCELALSCCDGHKTFKNQIFDGSKTTLWHKNC
ncbi:unnamed protein product [Acanthoscelides obtectus]|uniref:Uncharacterized protein n=1 Tax=Acanthoscelides obtectus TaxID=200917 RepID=A0A9P0NU79_ACAOB|nr:unnamed protein product [Acanthoscelides obtectus]